MYELISVSDSCHYFSCPSKIGLYTDGNNAYLIDSGNNSDAAKKALKTLDSMGLVLRAVLVTHSHADHIGGCAFLEEKTGCRIYSKGIEGAFTRFPILEPSVMYGGFPPEELRHRFLLATPSNAQEFSLPSGVETLELPGHSFDMIGYKMPDGTVFLGDALSSPATLEKYPLAVMWDISAQLETLERLKALDGNTFVLSHAETVSDLSELIEINASSIHRNCELILSLSREGISFENLLASIFTKLSMEMSFEQNALCSFTLRSYLTYLKNTKRLDLTISDNRINIKSK